MPLAQYQLGDMVQLDPQTVGVIVRLEKEAFKVLTQHGKEVNAKPHALQLRKSRGVALDSRQNEITSRDVVKVIQGPHIHKQGEIKHVFRGNVFLIVRDQVENGGIVVAKAKHVELAGGTSHAASSISTGFMPQSPRLSSPAPHRGPGTVSISSSAITTVLVASSATTCGGGGGGGGRGRGRGRGRGGRDTSIIGNTVRIVMGPYKGYVGIVKDATESTARVELHTSCNTISVDRSRLQSVTGQDRGGMTSTWGRTPAFGSQTPMVGSMTPSYGSMTPMHGGPGGRTPMYGSLTPMHGDGGRTPSYGYMTPSHDPSQTPLHGSSAWDPSVANTPHRSGILTSPLLVPDDWGFPYGESGSTPSPASYTNPATPGGASYDNPATPSPVGMPESPQGSTYSSGQYNARTPMYHSDYMTPSPAISPLTPGSMDFSPRTPGSPMEGGTAGLLPTDIEVLVKDNFESPHANKTGVVRAIAGKMASVYLYDTGHEVDIPTRYLEPTAPKKLDKVKGITGPNKGLIGALINIDEGDGIVKLDADSALKIIALDNLAKYVPKQQ
ncbi:Transcription elongation factor SPT5 [Geodia barretti]|uniref:Transcription elongation factor SPT5 n=1 Tax=Geodia barretti TaxID=519541 RepID=A0AA35R6T0_GEOBA|nr:Transcription elongation factor SPT5 [Geodia barretti]